MKIIVAQSAVARQPDLDPQVEALLAALESAEHKAQRLDLPTIESVEQAFSTIASYRLMSTSPWADALICLDAVTAVLFNERKFVWLLDTTFLGLDKPAPSGFGVPAADYLANVLWAGLNEAQACFTPSKSVALALKAVELPDVKAVKPGNWAPLLKAMGK